MLVAPNSRKDVMEKCACVSAIVLTYNEEDRVKDCLNSLQWCDEVWVVDSFSTDKTIEVCKSVGARVVQHVFEGFSKQRQWALEELPLAYEWVLFVDADEIVTSELATEIRKRLSDNWELMGFYVPRKEILWDKWLRFGDCWPGCMMRLLRRGYARFPLNEVHEDAVVAGKVGRLKNPLIHYSINSISQMLVRLDRYTTLEAKRLIRTRSSLFERDVPSYSRFRNVLKRLSVCVPIPLKPLAKFVWDYVIRQGFRDGRHGLAWAILNALYVYVAYFKVWEFEETSSGGSSGADFNAVGPMPTSPEANKKRE